MFSILFATALKIVGLSFYLDFFETISEDSIKIFSFYQRQNWCYRIKQRLSLYTEVKFRVVNGFLHHRQHFPRNFRLFII
jgi:hypothetical protein